VKDSAARPGVAKQAAHSAELRELIVMAHAFEATPRAFGKPNEVLAQVDASELTSTVGTGVRELSPPLRS